MSSSDMIVRLIVATLLGGLVGFERERLDRAAGLRTHALVAVASCLVMLVSAFGFADAVTADHTVILDPSRVAAQVVSGIGFLGAGTIIFRKNAVRGLTTAASIWAVAGLGLAVGGGLYVAAIASTIIMLVVLVGLRPLEGHLFAHKRTYGMTLQIQGAGRISAVEAAVVATGVKLQLLRLRPGENSDRLDIEVGPARLGDVNTLIEQLRTTPGVRAITCDRRAIRLLQPDESGAEDDTELTEIALPH